MTRTDADLEGFTRLHDVDAALSQHAPVEEGVAGPIREFDEPEAFVGVEPLDDPVDRGTGGVFERLAEAGVGVEFARVWVIGVDVEVATPRLTKILLSHFGSWWVPARSDRWNDSCCAVADLMGRGFDLIRSLSEKVLVAGV